MLHIDYFLEETKEKIVFFKGGTIFISRYSQRTWTLQLIEIISNTTWINLILWARRKYCHEWFKFRLLNLMIFLEGGFKRTISGGEGHSSSSCLLLISWHARLGNRRVNLQSDYLRIFSICRPEVWYVMRNMLSVPINGPNKYNHFLSLCYQFLNLLTRWNALWGYYSQRCSKIWSW